MTYKRTNRTQVVGVVEEATCDVLHKEIKPEDMAFRWSHWCISKEAVAMFPPFFQQEERLLRAVTMACGRENEQFKPEMLSSGWWLFICQEEGSLEEVFEYHESHWVMVAAPDKKTCFNRHLAGQTPFPEQLVHPERFQSICDIKEFLNENKGELYGNAIFAVHDASSIVQFDFTVESKPYVFPPVVEPPALKMVGGKPFELDTSKEDGSEPKEEVGQRLLFYAYSAGLGFYLQRVHPDPLYEQIMQPLEAAIDASTKGDKRKADDLRRSMAVFFDMWRRRGNKITWNSNPSLAKAISSRVEEIDKMPLAEAESHWNLLYQLALPIIGEGD